MTKQQKHTSKTKGGKKTIRERRLEALRELFSLYQYAKEKHIPRKFHDRATLNEIKKVQSRYDAENIDFSAKVGNAQRELLAANFDIPTQWMTVRLLGKLQIQALSTGMVTMEFEGADFNAIDAVLKDLAATIEKLENLPTLEPISPVARMILKKLESLSPEEGMTGPEILDWLSKEKNIEIDNKTLGNHLEQLEPFGKDNKKRIGYYIRK